MNNKIAEITIPQEYSYQIDGGKYLNNEKNTIPEKKHNSRSAFLEKLEKAPKGIFKLAVFQRRRDEYYQKLLDEEDRLCDDYKIK